LQAIYYIRCDARSIEERARAIAVEQSVEMPVAAIEDDFVRAEIVGRVEAIRQLDDALFEVRIALAAETVGTDAGQLVNMLFGNSSLHEDVVLHDVELPAELVRLFGGPRHGLHELRRRVGAGARALTCSALKPQGLPPSGSLPDSSRRAASTTSRTTMASPTRPIRRSRSASKRLRPRCAASSGQGAAPATCRACRATSMACAARSPPRRPPASIAS
jgi:hypothetical protein